MTTPAFRHWMRTTAAQQAISQQEHADNVQQDAQLLMLAKLHADSRTLKDIQSQAAKIEKKRELLPGYMPYVEGAMQGSASSDDVMLTVMVWLLDVGDFDQALQIGRHALAHNMVMPDRFKRNVATVLAEEIAEAQINGHTLDQPINGMVLIETAALVELQDLPDQVRAKLFKALGLFYEVNEEPAASLEAYERAFELNSKIGVKKNIDQQRRKANAAAKQSGTGTH